MMKKLLLTFVVAAFSACPVWADAMPKRYVLFGFELRRNANAQKFLNNAHLFRDVGLDGVGIYLPRKKRPDGTLSWSAMNDKLEWRYEDYAADIPLYREGFRKAGLTHNFLKEFFCAPKTRIDWLDDEAWARVARTLKLTARIAREMGCKGVCADHEDYHHSKQFARIATDLPYDELVKIARRRGREAFAAAFEEFPDMELFFYWFLGWRDRFFNCANPDAALRDNGELWPAFANGILDAMPPTVKLVDADEWAYYHPEKEYFDRSVRFRKVQCLGLVAPENREKYRRQVSMGFGLYTDMYINPKTMKNGKPHPFYRPPTDGSRLKTFAPLLNAATVASDEYVWFWNERVQWVKWNPPPEEKGVVTEFTLDDLLPGLRALCDASRNAKGFVRRREKELAEKGLLKELVANSTCESVGGKPEIPKPFFFWQSAASKTNGVGRVDPKGGVGGGSAFHVKNSRHGCIAATVPAAAGEWYVVRASMKGTGIMSVGVDMNFKNRKIEWWDRPGVTFAVPLSEPDAEGWRHGERLVYVLEGASGISLKPGWSQETGEEVWIDNISIKRLVGYDGGEDDPTVLLEKSRAGK